MSREIKFRAWDGNSVVSWEKISTILGIMHWMFVKTEGITLMQYTGLKDKNGKEIYEGDILRYDGALFMVVFGLGAIGMKRIIAEERKPTYRLHTIQGEVIGNVYENKELLQQNNK